MGRYKSVGQPRSDALTQVSWQDFERLLATWYEGHGFHPDNADSIEQAAAFTSDEPWVGFFQLDHRTIGAKWAP